MSLVTQITALAERVAEQFAAISSRLTPTGGSPGDVITLAQQGMYWDKPLASFPIFIATGNTAFNLAMNFITVPLNIVVQDSHDGWDQATNTYIVPQDGIYEVQGRIRIQDGMTLNTSVGIGIDTESIDNPGFIWSQTPDTVSASGASRYTMVLNRTLVLNAGDDLRLYGYWDGAQQEISGRELIIQRIR